MPLFIPRLRATGTAVAVGSLLTLGLAAPAAAEPATGTVRVTARDSLSGAAVTEFCVYSEAAYGCSGGSGQVELTGVPAGHTQVRVNIESDLYLPADTTVETPAGGTVDVAVAVEPAAAVETVVRDAATGAPVEGACAAAVPFGHAWTSGESFGRNCSDADGRVRIGYLRAGDTSLLVRPAAGSGYGAQWVGRSGGTGDQLLARVVRPQPGAVVSVPDVKLDRAATVTGRVTGSDGAPVAYGFVSPTTWHPGYDVDSGLGVDTDEDGRYTLDGLGPYRWPLVFSALGKPRTWSGGGANRYSAQRVAVTTNGTTTYDMVLADGATVTGTAPDELGWVIATNAITGDIMGVAWVDNGHYTMRVRGQQLLLVEGIPVVVPKAGTRTVNVPA